MNAVNYSPIFACRVGDGATFSGWIHITVAAMASTIRIRLLLEVNAILLCVCSTEFTISRQITLLTYDGRRFGILVIVLASCQCCQHGYCELSQED